MAVSVDTSTGKELLDATQSAVINAASNVGEVIEKTAHAAGGHEGPFYQNAEFWVGMAFIAVVVLLFKPISKVVGSMIHKRIEDIKKRIDDSSGLLDDAQKLLADYERKYRNAKKEAQAILEKSKKQIDYIKNENMSRLEQDMRSKEKDAEDRINSSQENADKELTELAASLTISTVKQALLDNLSEKTQDKLIDDSISAVGKLKQSA